MITYCSKCGLSKRENAGIFVCSDCNHRPLIQAVKLNNFTIFIDKNLGLDDEVVLYKIKESPLLPDPIHRFSILRLRERDKN
jgi:hypothetical protein